MTTPSGEYQGNPSTEETKARFLDVEGEVLTLPYSMRAQPMQVEPAYEEELETEDDE